MFRRILDIAAGALELVLGLFFFLMFLVGLLGLVGFAASLAAEAAHADPGPPGAIYAYDAPDGSIGFTNDLERVPARAVETVRLAAPSDRRWTPSGRARSPYRWYGVQPSYEARERHRFWAGQAEAARRGVEDAAALEALADELAIGRGAATQNRLNAERRAERLEEMCRTSGSCLPGDLR